MRSNQKTDIGNITHNGSRGWQSKTKVPLGDSRDHSSKKPTHASLMYAAAPSLQHDTKHDIERDVPIAPSSTFVKNDLGIANPAASFKTQADPLARRSIDMINDACRELSTKQAIPTAHSKLTAAEANKTVKRESDARIYSSGLVLPVVAALAGVTFFAWQQFAGNPAQFTEGQVPPGEIKQTGIAQQDVPVTNLLADSELENLKERLSQQPSVTVVEKTQTETSTSREPSAIVKADPTVAAQVDSVVSQISSGAQQSRTVTITQNLPINEAVNAEVQTAPTTPALRPYDDIGALTDNVVTELGKLKQAERAGNQVIASTQDLRNSISQLVAAATGQNQSVADIEQLLAEALANKDAVPQLLANQQGGLDIRSLIQGVITAEARKTSSQKGNSYLTALTVEGNATSLESGSGETNPFAENQRIIKTAEGYAVRVIQGDSLSKLAFELYGDPLAYERIYKANRKIIRSPNVLRLGTILNIPLPG